MINIKDSKILKGLMKYELDLNLIDIICYVADEYGLTMTESYRNKTHSNDLHGVIPVRAVDLRSTEYTPETLCYEIEHDINTKWIYDPERPEMKVAKIHDSGKGAHFHIQTHPNTILGDLMNCKDCKHKKECSTLMIELNVKHPRCKKTNLIQKKLITN